LLKNECQRNERSKSMAQTVVGLMDTIEEAHNVVLDLIDSGFDRDDISIMSRKDEEAEVVTEEKDTTSGIGSGTAKGAGAGAALGGIAGLVVGLTGLAIPGVGPIVAAGPLAATLAGAGIGAVAGGIVGALTELGVPEEDAHYYAEGVRRGGVLVTVATDDAAADRAAEIMRRHGAVDIDERAQQWRSTGWERFDEKATPYTSDQITKEREKVIPVVEEDVKIGKRDVQKGRVKVYSYVTERPVEKKVRLHEEHAEVNRRKVDRPAEEADLRAADTSYEVRETAEEPVIAKESRVVEEVSIGKEAKERVETVRDTERRTDVKVERTGADESSSIYEFLDPYSRDNRYGDKDWAVVEQDIHRDWEARYPGTWKTRKDEIRKEWTRSRAKTGKVSK
jgi:stress response protein YsnF